MVNFILRFRLFRARCFEAAGSRRGRGAGIYHSTLEHHLAELEGIFQNKKLAIYGEDLLPVIFQVQSVYETGVDGAGVRG